ncbi:hypothetical protein K523DRAFT_277434 [Schizophyllum commune Tattone D]|uniref:Uncharacterized protein n=1 Tax=Schizophyllum commune (strain H4-8 / FGSC 9210) TaxID=578458 RepID=D8QI37_SCHCM|nr:uncharacterized protein SCHCODRAFT_02706276 [Schizophyllum commune H4-8]KAI4522160.1 hypothetical protein K525DRAFT_247040 [Schizophyllum commune Loenen D]KAI5828129.1 hypothetical protein K523DRAFT_277434 [Schizophyllum commune Tattone D]KAI5885845.1 hypothetical protein SCHCODRAFT_02706276 [Schizophyllum commune H4-8]
MKTAAVFASLVALVGATTLVEPRQDSDYPDCEPTTGAFYIPDSITVGEPFPVRFCSSTYFKTSSKSITLAIGRDSTNVSGSVIMTDELTTKDNKKYDFEATIPYSSTIKFSETSPLIVVEKINDYYVSESFQVVTTDAHLVYPEES